MEFQKESIRCHQSVDNSLGIYKQNLSRLKKKTKTDYKAPLQHSTALLLFSDCCKKRGYLTCFKEGFYFACLSLVGRTRTFVRAFPERTPLVWSAGVWQDSSRGVLPFWPPSSSVKYFFWKEDLIAMCVYSTSRIYLREDKTAISKRRWGEEGRVEKKEGEGFRKKGN